MSGGDIVDHPRGAQVGDDRGSRMFGENMVGNQREGEFLADGFAVFGDDGGAGAIAVEAEPDIGIQAGEDAAGLAAVARPGFGIMREIAIGNMVQRDQPESEFIGQPGNHAGGGPIAGIDHDQRPPLPDGIGIDLFQQGANEGIDLGSPFFQGPEMAPVATDELPAMEDVQQFSPLVGWQDGSVLSEDGEAVPFRRRIAAGDVDAAAKLGIGADVMLGDRHGADPEIDHAGSAGDQSRNQRRPQHRCRGPRIPGHHDWTGPEIAPDGIAITDREHRGKGIADNSMATIGVDAERSHDICPP